VLPSDAKLFANMQNSNMVINGIETYSLAAMPSHPGKGYICNLARGGSKETTSLPWLLVHSKVTKPRIPEAQHEP
jgi:hypothetical protein